MELIKKLFSSQKFLVLVAGAIGLLLTKIFKVQVEQTTILEWVVLISGYLVGQGIADNGKGAAKVQAIASLTANPDVSPADTKTAVESIKAV